MKYVLVALLFFSTACASTMPTGLNPQAVTAWHQMEVTKSLDRVVDAANDAHSTTPPLIDAATNLQIVQWHELAITVVHDQKAGWQTQLNTVLDGLQARLSPGAWSMISPYVKFVQNILKEAQQ